MGRVIKNISGYASLILIPILAIVLSMSFRLPYLASIVLFYGLPGLYFAIKSRDLRKIGNVALFSIVASIPFAIIVDVIGTLSKCWYVPESLFPSRFMGIMPWEDFVWMIVATFTIIMILETVSLRIRNGLLNKRMSFFVVVAIIVLSVFIFIVKTDQTLFAWSGNYTYLILGTVFFLFPAVLFLPNILRSKSKVLWAVIYFFCLTLLFEITATYLNQWIFTGQYLIPPLVIFKPIPFEELFFVGIVGPLAAIGFYNLLNKPMKLGK